MNQKVATHLSAEVIGTLLEGLARFRKSEIYNEIVEPRGTVLGMFQPIFAPGNVSNISEEEFRSFLYDKNNHHWSGLHRQGSRMCADMGKLREALVILVNEEMPVADRLDRAIEMVLGLGRNTATAILLITQPGKYGVWNSRSEANLRQLGIWPTFDWGESFGSKYVKVNQVLLQLCDKLHTDLWTLDGLWWYLDQEPVDLSVIPLARFGMERHLHEFLRDNWDQTELGREWGLYQEREDLEAGYEYPCDVGRIDLLAKHRREPRWLVVELKRGQTSDQTVGQLLRYIGWVRAHLAEESETVHGMVICHEADKPLHYALSTLANVELRLYGVEFHLKKSEVIIGKNS